MNVMAKRKTCIRSVLLVAIIVSTVILATLFCSAVLSRQNLPDYILLIDTSGSMQRVLGEELQGHSIIDYVKEVAKDLGKKCIKGTRVYVYTFDDGIQSEREFLIESDDSRKNLVARIDSLVAEGQKTHIYESLEKVSEKHRYSPENSNYALLYVFTDGVDTSQRGPKLAIEYLREHLTQRGYSVYYTTFGKSTLKPEERTALEKDLRMFHEGGIPLTDQPPGAIMTVTPLEDMLDFGNLRSFEMKPGDDPLQELTLYTLSPSDLPADFKIEMEFEFADFRGTNHSARPTPESFSLSTTEHYNSRQCTMKVSNIDLTLAGEHHGKLKLIDADPMIVIAPDVIPIVFRYEAERIVTVTTNWKDEEVNFEEINPYDISAGISDKFLLTFEYNQAAQENGGSLELMLSSDDDNERLFGDSLYFLINGKRGNQITVSPGISEVALQVKAMAGASNADFKFTLEGFSRDMTVQFPGIEVKNNRFFMAGSFSVAAQPWPWWYWVLIILVVLILAFVIGLVVFALFTGETPFEVLGKMCSCFRAPVLPDATIAVMKPSEFSNQEINIRGKRQVKIGGGGEFLADVGQASILLTPAKHGGNVWLSARTIAGTALLKTVDEKDAFPLIKSEIFDGDRIIIGEYELGITSFALIRA